jgi:NAD(P)-dependent dehydrogenase (short-subunit alcohol dehydrogenase family)
LSRSHEGRTMLISGGTSGIGLATARRLIAEGARVWVLGSATETVSAALGGLPSGVAGGCACDVSSDEEVERAVRRALKFLGRLDAVFVSAGIDGQGRPALELDPAYFRRVLEVNLLGAFIVARAAGRAMDGGAIVLNASVNGLRAEAGFADYNASKSGVVMLARTLARDLGAQGFWVTAVCPGYVRTRMTASYLDDPANAAELLAEIPSGRFGEPDEVAALVSFLASPEASYMNGSVVTIDGGRVA